MRVARTSSIAFAVLLLACGKTKSPEVTAKPDPVVVETGADAGQKPPRKPELVPEVGGAVLRTDGDDVFFLREGPEGGVYQVGVAGGAAKVIHREDRMMWALAVDAANVYWLAGEPRKSALMTGKRDGTGKRVLAANVNAWKTGAPVVIEGAIFLSYGGETDAPNVGNLQRYDLATGAQTIVGTKLYWPRNFVALGSDLFFTTNVFVGADAYVHRVAAAGGTIADVADDPEVPGQALAMARSGSGLVLVTQKSPTVYRVDPSGGKPKVVPGTTETGKWAVGLAADTSSAYLLIGEDTSIYPRTGTEIRRIRTDDVVEKFADVEPSTEIFASDRYVLVRTKKGDLLRFDK